jgi:diguanylate cyclase (GGDEF)-like protein
MPVTPAHRGRVLALAAALAGLALATTAVFDLPASGVGYVLYLPVALVGLVASPFAGAAAGVVASEIYALAAAVGSGPAGDGLLTTTSALRLLTYAAIGAVIGKLATDHRSVTTQLRRLADVDPLTGLLNRRAYDAALARRLVAGAPFALVLVDMDGLKELNDTRGHAAGNEALTRLSRTLAGAVRRDDDVARIGGDEFAVLVGGASSPEVGFLVERLAGTLAAAGVSASLGWAVAPDEGTSASTLFERADERLYEHKAQRRAASAGGREVTAEHLV